MMKSTPLLSNLRLFATVSIALLSGATIIYVAIARISDASAASGVGESPAREIQLRAILHYATSKEVPQQSLQEITLSFNVLRARAPCNFLVFGVGLDSLMWASLNPAGTTLFLEEDPKWIQIVLRDFPDLRVSAVRYPTKLSQADRLLSGYRSDPNCWPGLAEFRSDAKCRLALIDLPEEVYGMEWDVVMIDAPRGYFADAPGRMSAIYTAAVLSRRRKGSGVTDVFLHDVNRRVEKVYAQEFLCRKFRMSAAGKLWHFRIPPAERSEGGGAAFC